MVSEAGEIRLEDMTVEGRGASSGHRLEKVLRNCPITPPTGLQLVMEGEHTIVRETTSH